MLRIALRTGGFGALVALVVAAGCSDPAPAPEQKEARKFFDDMAAIARDIHAASAETRSLTEQVYNSAINGQKLDKAMIEKAIQTQLTKLQKVRSRAEIAKSPAGASGEALQLAMIRGLEGEERRLRVGIHEWLDVLADDSLSLSEKKEKAKKIGDRLQAERNEDETAIKKARETFAKDFHITKQQN
jgi:hypothetical protein